MQMLPTALIYFHEVARTGSVSEAATALLVSPSAISRQISQLERQVGTPIFRRHPRGMQLTDAGVLLLAHTRRAEAEGEQLIEDLSQLAAGTRRVIHVAASEGLSAFALPAAISRFNREYPEVTVRLSVLASQEATQRVVEGEADIAAVFALGPQHEVKVELSCPAPGYAVVHRDHPLASHSRVELSEFCSYPLAMPERGVTQRELFDIAAEMEGLRPRIVLATNYLNPALEFARSGEGATLLSHYARRPGVTSDLRFIPFIHPALSQRSAQILTMPRRRQTVLASELIRRMGDELRTWEPDPEHE
ncbi:LysR family transcriptional regulator [Glutamicibacter sp. X7]